MGEPVHSCVGSPTKLLIFMHSSNVAMLRQLNVLRSSRPFPSIEVGKESGRRKFVVFVCFFCFFLFVFCCCCFLLLLLFWGGEFFFWIFYLSGIAIVATSIFHINSRT